MPAGVSLVLELTERFLLGESARTAAIFNALKAKGVQFAMDDFGTEHSNLKRTGNLGDRFAGVKQPSALQRVAHSNGLPPRPVGCCR